MTWEEALEEAQAIRDGLANLQREAHVGLALGPTLQSAVDQAAAVAWRLEQLVATIPVDQGAAQADDEDDGRGHVLPVETSGPKVLVLCASQHGADEDVPTHALRRLELALNAVEDDCVVTACGDVLSRPVAVFYAPTDEIDCAECYVAVTRTRKLS